MEMVRPRALSKTLWKNLALAIIQTFRNLQVKEQTKRIVVTLTSCGRFLSFGLGFLQVP